MQLSVAGLMVMLAEPPEEPPAERTMKEEARQREWVPAGVRGFSVNGAAVLDRATVGAQDRRDQGAHAPEGDDRDDRDEGENQGVFSQTLAPVSYTHLR